jgi:hypothetical protein
VPEGIVSVPSRITTIMTWLAVGVSAGLIALGFHWYGFSVEVRQRFWSDILDRVHGPMTFRFYLQPVMAAVAALADGLRDVREGHKSFLWSTHGDPNAQAGRLREGLTSTARVVLLGLSMDAIYQFRVLDQFYPAEAVTMALLLAVIPYFVARWIVEHVARWWQGRRGHRQMRS